MKLKNFIFNNIKKDLLIAYSYKGQFIGSYLAIFFNMIIFFYFIKFAGSDSFNDLFSFIFIGIVMSDCLLIISRSCATQITTFKNQGIFEELMTCPVRNIFLVLSSIPYSIFSSITRLICYISFFLFFTDYNFVTVNLMVIVSAFLLAVMSFIGVSLIAAAFSIIFFRGGAVILIFSGASTIFGGVFYPTSTFNFNIDFISIFLSIKPTLDLIRSSIGVIELDKIEIFYSFLNLIILSVFYILIGYFLTKYAIKHAKEKGTFSHF